MAKLIIQHQVRDYDTWFRVFSKHTDTRRKYGATSHTVSRSVADPNTVVVVNDFATTAGAQAFSADPTLREAMARAGVDGAPQVWITEDSDVFTY